MEIEVLGGFGGESLECRMTCLLVNQVIALDAGSLSQALSIERQREVHSIVLSHSHMDHTNSLPFFVENVFGKLREAVDIHASPATIYALRKHLFNNDTWPDFTRLPNHLLPAVRFHELDDEVPVKVGDVTFTPIPVDHLVPTYGYLIEQGDVAVLWSSDTGPTKRLWEIANATPHLKAICIDTSFDNALQQIADVSLHLTPRTLAVELRQLTRRVPILLHHLKPPCIDRIKAEASAELDSSKLKAQLKEAEENLRRAQAEAGLGGKSGTRAKVLERKALLSEAELQLSYTKIYAARDGYITRKSLEPGANIQAGQSLMALVPLQDAWITANYKERQITHMQPGQKVKFRVDAYPGRTFTGQVDSIMAGTGAAFSLLPPENATGNYVKVVQRVPVKIVLEPGQDPDHRLRPGMSVVPTVYTK